MKPTRSVPHLVLLCASLAVASSAQGQAVDPFYSGHYSIRTLTNITGVPRTYGGVTIRTNNPNTLLVAGGCESSGAKIYQVTVQRAPDGHITNFTGAATVLANTPGGSQDGNPPWTGLSGDWDFGPGGVLFYLSPDGYLNQVKPGFSTPSKQTDLGGTLGLTVGTVVSVPAGLPGAGRLKLLTRNHQFWHDVPFTSDGAGTYDVGSPTTTVELVGTLLIAAGRAGTPSAGRIFLLFEGGAGGRRAGIQVSVFNLSWLLNGRELSDLLDKRIERK